MQEKRSKKRVLGTELTYKDIADVVEDLVRIKSRKYAKRYIGYEDIAQEIRIKCWKSISSYDSDKGQSIKTYLNVCTENHLRNIIRDKFATFNPPCKKTCAHYDDNGRATKDAEFCKAYVNYLAKYKRKCSVRMPFSIDSVFRNTAEGISSFCVEEQDKNLYYDLDDEIKNLLGRKDRDLLVYYEILKEGKKIPRNAHSKILSLVKEIVNDDK